MKKIVLEVPLREHMRPDVLTQTAQLFREALTKALGGCTVGERTVHVPGRITVRVEQDTEARSGHGMR